LQGEIADETEAPVLRFTKGLQFTRDTEQFNHEETLS